MSDEHDHRLRVLEQQIADLRGQLSRLTGPFQRVFLAKPNADDAALWHEQTVNAGEIAEFTDGRRRTDTEDAFAIIEPGTAIPVLEIDDYHEGDRVKRYVKLASAGVIVVTLASTGGAANPVSWVYTATPEAGGSPLGTSLTPIHRPLAGKVTTAATKGLGDYGGANGAFRLLMAFETFGTTSCT